MTEKLATLCLLVALPCAAAEYSGDDLLDRLTAMRELDSGFPAPEIKAGVFKGYVAAVIDAGNRRDFCISVTMCSCEVYDAVEAALKDPQTRLDRPANQLVTEALAKRFPCAEKK